MRRLFWTFPNGLPGIGLLLLRLALAVALLDGVAAMWQRPLSAPSLVLSVVETLSAAGLLLGFGTPFWAAGTAAIEVWSAASDPTAFLIHALMAAISAALTLLGPGAASVDAWLFGWQRLDVRDRRR